MKRYGMFIAIGLLILVNAVVMAGVAYNRSEEPEATLTLTERELPIEAFNNVSDRENTGLSFRLNWSANFKYRMYFLDEPWFSNRQAEWFDKTKLEAIGFDCSLPLNDPGAERHYKKMLPRKTYAVLEYEGSAWEAWLADANQDLADAETRAKQGNLSYEKLKEARKEIDRAIRSSSRLFVVDVSNDPKQLRARYSEPGRYMILPATVRLKYFIPASRENKKQGPPRLIGEVEKILTDTIHIPKKHNAFIEKAMIIQPLYARPSGAPLYEVKIHVGKRFEPWVADVRPLTVEATK